VLFRVCLIQFFAFNSMFSVLELTIVSSIESHLRSGKVDLVLVGLLVR